MTDQLSRRGVLARLLGAATAVVAPAITGLGDATEAQEARRDNQTGTDAVIVFKKGHEHLVNQRLTREQANQIAHALGERERSRRTGAAYDRRPNGDGFESHTTRSIDMVLADIYGVDAVSPFTWENETAHLCKNQNNQTGFLVMRYSGEELVTNKRDFKAAVQISGNGWTVEGNETSYNGGNLNIFSTRDADSCMQVTDRGQGFLGVKVPRLER